MATSINLAPGTQYLIEARKRRRRLFIISAVIAVVAGLAFFGLMLFKSSLEGQASSVQDSIRNIDEQTAQLETDAKRIVLFEDRLLSLNSLLNTHIGWSPFFSELERLLTATTTIKSLDVSADSGQVSFTGLTPDIDTAALLLASLLNAGEHKTIFTDGNIGNIARHEVQGEAGQVTTAQYQFSATMSFSPDVLAANK